VTVFSRLKKQYKLKPIEQKTNQKIISRPLTNPDFLTRVKKYWDSAPKHAWPDTPYYTGTGLHWSKNCSITPETLQVCGNHDARKDYNDTLLYKECLAPDLLKGISPFPMVRCKIGCLNSTAAIGFNQKNSWHRDETPYEVLRVIVPIETHSSYRFQMDNEPDINLEHGKIYAFDQSLYHRVFSTDITDKTRLHLILSFVCWFSLEDDKWIPSPWFNKTHPMDLLDYINL
jgi:hypothetical protein